MSDSTTKQTVVLSGLRSDSHTWNLAYLKIYLEERGFAVTNLGSCVPPAELATVCNEVKPSLVVLSSVNGHGSVEGCDAIDALRSAGCVPGVPVVIGGKLTTSLDSDSEARLRLLHRGFDGVFTGAASLPEFECFLIDHGLLTPPVHAVLMA